MILRAQTVARGSGLSVGASVSTSSGVSRHFSLFFFFFFLLSLFVLPWMQPSLNRPSEAEIAVYGMMLIGTGRRRKVWGGFGVSQIPIKLTASFLSVLNGSSRVFSLQPSLNESLISTSCNNITSVSDTWFRIPGKTWNLKQDGTPEACTYARVRRPLMVAACVFLPFAT